MNPLTYIAINISIIDLIWIGAVRVNSGNLTQRQVVALYNYMSQILVEIIKLANLVINITKALACAGDYSLSDINFKAYRGQTIGVIGWNHCIFTMDHEYM